MLKYLLGFFLVVVVVNLSFAAKEELLKGWLVKSEGGRLDNIYIKYFDAEADEIKFNTDNGDRFHKIDTEDLMEIGVILEEDSLAMHLYKSAKYNMFGKLKVSKKPKIWCAKTYESDLLIGYRYFSVGEQRVRHANGYLDYKTVIENCLGMQYTGEDYVLYCSQLQMGNWDPFSAKDKLMRNVLKKYFEDRCPSASKMIKENKYAVQQFQEVLEMISSECH